VVRIFSRVFIAKKKCDSANHKAAALVVILLAGYCDQTSSSLTKDLATIFICVLDEIHRSGTLITEVFLNFSKKKYKTIKKEP